MTVTSDATSVTITHPSNPKTSLKILNFGATAISWTVDGVEKLWLSESAKLDGSKAVRGGIPIVFPRFGPSTGDHPATDKLPQHGFARIAPWEFLGELDETSVQFGLGPEQLSEAQREMWGYSFTLLLTFTLNASDIFIKLEVENTDVKPFDFTTLLHTYFRVPEVEKTTVDGFGGLNYRNVFTGESAESKDSVLSFHAAFDNVYHATPDHHVISYENKPLFTLDSSKSLPDTVVWNPWLEGAEEMGDFTPKNAYHEMICVENGSVQKFLQLAPTEKYAAELQITAN